MKVITQGFTYELPHHADPKQATTLRIAQWTRSKIAPSGEPVLVQDGVSTLDLAEVLLDRVRFLVNSAPAGPSIPALMALCHLENALSHMRPPSRKPVAVEDPPPQGEPLKEAK